MGKISSFKDLRVWQISVDLVEDIYKISEKLPKTELFGLVSQMQRAAVSIPSNIAEGSKRGSRADFKQFCKISLGSAAELETQLLIVERLYPGIRLDSEIFQKIEDIQKMLGSLANKLQTYEQKPKTDKL